MKSSVDALSTEGFVKVGSVLSSADAEHLREECSRLFSGPSLPYVEYQKHRHESTYQTRVYADHDWTVGADIVGWSPALDDLIGKIVTHPRIKGTLEGVLGAGYKLWQVNVRRHEPGSQGQPLHQDAPGGLGLSVLVSERTGLEGATVFLPSSHRWPIEYSDVGFTLHPKRMTRLLGSASGDSGDASFFFNRTWHGRYPGDTPATAILMAFFCVGSKYPIHETPEDVLRGLNPELRRLLDPNVGLRRVSKGEVLVIGPDGATVPPLAREELRFALTGPGPAAPLSPWRFVRGWSHLRKLGIRVVGRERLQLLSDSVGAVMR